MSKIKVGDLVEIRHYEFGSHVDEKVTVVKIAGAVVWYVNDDGVCFIAGLNNVKLVTAAEFPEFQLLDRIKRVSAQFQEIGYPHSSRAYALCASMTVLLEAYEATWR